MKFKTFFAVLFLSFINIFAQSEDVKLGAQITLDEKTKISDILADPDVYLNQTVLIEGEILDVCPKMGCWMQLKSDDGEGMIKVKVKDGDIVFPIEAIGDYAIVEGTVYKIDLTQEEAADYFEHLAEESGKDFDPSIITGPMTIYQIKGLGAEIIQNEG